MYACACVCECVCMCMCICGCVCVCVCVDRWVGGWVWVCVHVCVHGCMYVGKFCLWPMNTFVHCWSREFSIRISCTNGLVCVCTLYVWMCLCVWVHPAQRRSWLLAYVLYCCRHRHVHTHTQYTQANTHTHCCIIMMVKRTLLALYYSSFALWSVPIILTAALVNDVQ